MKDYMNELIEDEGFSGTVYTDTEGFETIGIGSRLPLSLEEAKMIAEKRYKVFVNNLLEAKPIIHRLPQEKQFALFNMAFNLGVSGALNFKNMWRALEQFDYDRAADEMLDSRWFSQVPNRAKKLSDIIRG